MAAGHSREVELKYAVDDPAAVREMLDGEVVAGLRAGPWRVLSLTDRYLDTTSRALERAGYGVRLRREGRQTTLTVKGVRAQGRDEDRRAARHDRLELEARATQRLDPTGWPESAARSVVEAAAHGERLRTLFTVTQRRHERELCREDGSPLAVLSFDEAEVSKFARTLGTFTIVEVELAQHEGAADAEDDDQLDRIAEELERSGLLRPEGRSKEELGNELVKASARRATKPPKRPGVTADDQLSEAGRKVLRMHLLRMLENEAGSRDGDVESVHRMRVATRRMRAAWRVFTGAYRTRVEERHVEELRVVAQTLGAVRDMDVQLEGLQAHALTRPEATRGALVPLAEEWQRRRDEARDQLLDLLASADYDRFVTDYLEFVDTPGEGAAANGPGLVADAAASRIWRAYERLHAHSALVQFADVPALHALRIDSKRLRYTLEFFAEVMPPSAATLVAELTALQDHLGLLNDAFVTATLTRSWLLTWAAQLPLDSRRAIGAYLTASERDIERLRRSFARMWRTVMSRSFRRRLALAIGDI